MRNPASDTSEIQGHQMNDRLSADGGPMRGDSRHDRADELDALGVLLPAQEARYSIGQLFMGGGRYGR